MPPVAGPLAWPAGVGAEGALGVTSLPAERMPWVSQPGLPQPAKARPPEADAT